jgi:hypothetical protein
MTSWLTRECPCGHPVWFHFKGGCVRCKCVNKRAVAVEVRA